MSLNDVTTKFNLLASVLRAGLDAEDAIPADFAAATVDSIQAGDLILVRKQLGRVVSINERTGWIRYQHLYRMSTGTLIPVEAWSSSPEREVTVIS